MYTYLSFWINKFLKLGKKHMFDHHSSLLFFDYNAALNLASCSCSYKDTKPVHAIRDCPQVIGFIILSTSVSLSLKGQY